MNQEDKLRAYWSKREKELMLHYPSGMSTRSDSRWLGRVFGDEFCAELKKRGYDITTLRFSVEPQKGNKRFVSQRESQLCPNCGKAGEMFTADLDWCPSCKHQWDGK